MRNVLRTGLAAALLLWVAATGRAHMPHDFISDIAVAPGFADEPVIFAISRYALMRTDDGGETWRRVTYGLGHHSLSAVAVSPDFAADRAVFCGDRYGQVFRSTDGGRTFFPASMEPLPSAVESLRVSPGFAEDRTLYARSSSGALLRSTDEGETWVELAVGSSRVTAFDVSGKRLVAGTDAGDILESADAGEHWTAIATAGAAIACVEVPPARADEDPAPTVYAGTADGALRVHGGEATPCGSLSEHVTALESAVRGDHVVLFAATWKRAVFLSEDGGENWTLHSEGLYTNAQADQERRPHFSHLQATDDGTLVLAGFCGVFTTRDPAAGFVKRHTIPMGMITGLRVVEGAGGSPPILFVSTYGAGFYRSEDGGDTWLAANTGLPVLRLGPLEVSPHVLGDGRVLTASYGQVMLSNDRGDTWRAMPLPSWKTIPCLLAASPRFPREPVLFAAAVPDGLLRSRDGGRSFRPVGSLDDRPAFFVALSPDFSDDRTLFASCARSLHRSLDAGATWEAIGTRETRGAIVAVSPAFASDRTLFAGSSSGLFVSRDAGESFAPWPLGEHGGAVATIGLSPSFATDREFAVQVRGGDLLLCRDDSDGPSVEATPHAREGLEFSHPRGFGREVMPLIVFSPRYAEDRTVFGGSMDRLYRSRDGGRTWKPLDTPLRYESAWTTDLDMGWRALRLEGEWQKRSGPRFTAASCFASRHAGDAAEFSFTGREVAWIGIHGSAHGEADVYIDGEHAGVASQRADSTSVAAVTFRAGDLGDGPHVLRIVVRGEETEGTDGTVGPVYIDAFDVYR